MQTRKLACCFLATLVPACCSTHPSATTDAARSEQKLRIDADFPGGNIVVEGIEGNRVTLRNSQRDTEGWWFYWYFRVQGAAGRTLTFSFEGCRRPPVSVYGPAVSTDAGRTWKWLGHESVERHSFTYSFGADVAEARFCVAMPYTDSDLQSFLQRHHGSPHLKLGRLTTSRKGRKVHTLRIGRLDGQCMHRVLITARHHACETMANFMLEGIMETVIAYPRGQWLRENVEFLAVPFMDTDGVEEGDQGKSRMPHDHNRDYRNTSIYPEVATMRELGPRWGDGKLHLAFDLHCPGLSGGGNETLFFVGPQDPRHWENLQRFSCILESLPVNGLPFYSENNLPFGKNWNTAERFVHGKTMTRWAAEIPGIDFASTLEVPYANASGTAVTAESARVFGGTFAEAITRYLRSRK